MSFKSENKDNSHKNGTVNSLTSCRICLKDGTIPIHNNSNGDLATAISAMAGIQVGESDPYPKYLCPNCHVILQGAILLRKTAQNTVKILRKIPCSQKYGALDVDKNIVSSTVNDSTIKLECDSDNISNSGKDEKQGKSCLDFKQFVKQNICAKCNRTLECSYCNSKVLCTNEKDITCVKRKFDTNMTNCILPQERNVKESISKKVKVKKVLKKTIKHDIIRLDEDTKLNDKESKSLKSCYHGSIKKKYMSQIDNNSESDADCIPLHHLENKIKHKSKPIVKEKVITCKYCNIQVNGGKEYLKHAQTAEHKEKRNYCSICDKTFSETYMRKHRRKHKNPEREHTMCDVCGKKFSDQGNLRRHKAIHTSNFPFKCSLCPYRGPAADYLKSHMLVHSREKSFVCDECPQNFHRRCNLLAHKKKAHTNEDRHKFVCDCGKKYTSKQKLDMHYQSIHTGKQEICRDCGKCFSYRTSLARHELKVHRREKLKRSSYLRIEKEVAFEDKV